MNPLKTLFHAALGRREPRWEGTLRAAGLGAPVTVRRDRWGIPHVEASTDEDAWFGLGFCHAQDRAGQLEVFVRMVRGTLSEVAGAEMLPVDRLSRRLGARRAAAAQLPGFDPDIRAEFRAYVQGVNAGLRLGRAHRAHEHSLLRCAPTPWEPEDAQGLQVLMCFALAANWDIELARLRVLELDGPEALAKLDPAYPEWLAASAAPLQAAGRPGAAAERLAQDLALFAETVGLGGGSNAWAVSGARTRSGRPLVASDPHLLPSAPNAWYLAHLQTPAWAAAGATFAGIPGVPIGHNGAAAWGVTAAHVDNTDLVLEELGRDGDEARVRVGDRWLPCEVRREVIGVRGGPEHVEEVIVTPHGPLISPLLPGGQGAERAIALQATWLSARPNRALQAVHRARTAADFRAAFAQATTTNGGLVFADEGGRVGWLIAADAPRRKRGHGHLPQAGWDPAAGWEDAPVPADAMPFVVDPPEGFVATANNQPVPDDPDTGVPPGPHLGVDWLDGYRHKAIVEALSARDDWDPSATAALQMDVRSLAWRDAAPAFRALEPLGDPDAERGRRMLRDWDGVLGADSPQATVWVFTATSLLRRVVRAVAPRAAADALGRGVFRELLPYNLLIARRMSFLVRLLREQPDGYLDVPWADALAAALGETVRELRRSFGGEPDAWAWGRVRPLWLTHPFGDKRPLDRVFNVGPIAVGGDATTIAQASVDPLEPTANPAGISTMRMVVELGDWEGARFILLGGQSGNPLSPHYDDMVPLWAQGSGVPIHWAPEAVRAATEYLLTLLPER